MGDFSTETPVKAVRKQHQCSACRKMVEVGEPAIRWSGCQGGSFGSVVYHPDCRAAEIEMNRECGGNWDEWYSLGDDRQREDDTWLLADFPAVAARLGIQPKDTPNG